jgi:hypothetical protein
VIPWWTAFWALPDRAVMREVRRASPRTPRVLLCHNVEDHEGGPLKRLLARGALTVADGFVAHAASDRERLVRIAPRSPVLTLPHPVEILPARSREEARRRLGSTIRRSSSSSGSCGATRASTSCSTPRRRSFGGRAPASPSWVRCSRTRRSCRAAPPRAR